MIYSELIIRKLDQMKGKPCGCKLYFKLTGVNPADICPYQWDDDLLCYRLAPAEHPDNVDVFYFVAWEDVLSIALKEVE